MFWRAPRAAVHNAIAEMIVALKARTADGVASKAKAMAWNDGVRVGVPSC